VYYRETSEERNGTADTSALSWREGAGVGHGMIGAVCDEGEQSADWLEKCEGMCAMGVTNVDPKSEDCDLTLPSGAPGA
jgi:hypothetical protein